MKKKKHILREKEQKPNFLHVIIHSIRNTVPNCSVYTDAGKHPFSSQWRLISR